jgi:CRP-like cAMP-binding protein
MPSRRDAAANRLLAALPRADRSRLLTKMERIRLSAGEVLYKSGDPFNFACFPEDALVSVGIVVDGRPALEITMIGAEGMVAASLAAGMATAAFAKTVSAPGFALRIDAKQFQAELDTLPALRTAAMRFLQSMWLQTAQSAACHRYHVVEARLARWLLAHRDRTGKKEFRVTQEFLSRLLGVRRVGVTNAATSLKQNKLVCYSRGNLEIINGPGLEAVACSCYLRNPDGR